MRALWWLTALLITAAFIGFAAAPWAGGWNAGASLAIDAVVCVVAAFVAWLLAVVAG